MPVMVMTLPAGGWTVASESSQLAVQARVRAPLADGTVMSEGTVITRVPESGIGLDALKVKP